MHPNKAYVCKPELLPCPHCAGEAREYAGGAQGFPDVWGVACSSCGAIVEDDNDGGHIKKWNDRAVCTGCVEIGEYQKLLPALREFLWMAICWNDHTFEDGTIAMKCRDLCRELGIQDIDDANDLLGRFDRSETTKDSQ